MSSALRLVMAGVAAVGLTAGCSKRPIGPTPQDAMPQDAVPPQDAMPQDAVPQDAVPPQDAMPQDPMPHPRACVVAAPAQPPPYPTEFRFLN